MRETLTSRERVVRALNHQPVDRMPIDLGSHFSTGISAFAYWNLRRHLGLSTDHIWVPDVVQMLACVEAALQANLAHVAKVIDAMGEWIQLISINADMGFQTGPMCRPSLIEELVAPYIARFCDFVHRNSDCKVFHHCCGSIKPLIPILIEAGVDALNPVQISADDMDAAELVAAFGDEIVFWGGGCDTQNVLGVATPDEVAANVRELVGTFKRGSGFMFNAVHNITQRFQTESLCDLGVLCAFASRFVVKANCYHGSIGMCGWGES